MAEFGYAGKILKIDLSQGKVHELATAPYADRFIGGKGIAAKLYWDFAPPQAKAFDPENCLVCASGPLAGFPRFCSSRWIVCGKTASNDPEAFCYGNMGGSFGNRLKYGGYDGLVVQGKAEKPVYLFIHDGQVDTRDASHLWGRSAHESLETLEAEFGKSASVLTIGPAAENLVVFSTLFASQGASASGGTGTIMGSKKLKAIVVAGDTKPVAADPERLRKLGDRFHELTSGPMPPFWWVVPGRTKQQACNACGVGCSRQIYTGADGKQYKSFCQPIDIYRRPASKYYQGWHEAIFTAMQLCDGYGLDSSVMQAMIEWLKKCFVEGVLSEAATGLPLARIGSTEFIEILTRKIAMREGFGELLAQGMVKAAEVIGVPARQWISYSVMNRSNEAKDYDPRLLLHNALVIATEPRRPTQQVHEASGVLIQWLNWLEGMKGAYMTPEVIRNIAETYWGSVQAGDFSTYEGKALASKKIQDRTYAQESLVLCNAKWPMLSNPLTGNHMGDPALPGQIYSAVTGRETDTAELERIGERIFNLQRAIFMREGWGGRSGDRLLDFHHETPVEYLRYDRECKVPGQGGEVASRKGKVIDRQKFEEIKSEYYALRGWDSATGFQTGARLKELQLDDVAADLEKRGLLK